MLAAWLDSYGRGLRLALSRAREDGYRQCAARGTGTELDPASLSRTGRRHLIRHLADLNLKLACLAAEFPGHLLDDAQRAEERLARVRALLEMCAEMNVPRASVRLGSLRDPATRGLAQQVLAELADLSDRTGIVLAVGGEGPVIADCLRALGCPHVGVWLDSAAWTGERAALRSVAERAQLVDLRDARRIGERVEETALGRGEVDFATLLAVLEEHDYRGPLVIRREGAGPVDTLRDGREYIESLLTGGARV
jgi:sugar phosphate isomerase/epimerase